MTVTTQENRWRARPWLAAASRGALLAVPVVASSATVYGLARLLPPSLVSSWQGLAVLLLTAVGVTMLMQRAARRLLPVTILLRLTMIFPDRAPSRLKMARSSARRKPSAELLWVGPTARPMTIGETVLALVSTLGVHDRRTRGHSERVRVLCEMLAGELSLDRDDRDKLLWTALLHDVGKLQVAAGVLNKPAKLDNREFEAIKAHPVVGAELTSPLMPWLGEWSRGIVEHHEKYDGTGYPDGKAGRDISTAGRIIGLVDAFETMTAARPYKKAMATKNARAELARCAGTHFDPVLVRAFLAISLPRMLWAMGPLSFLCQAPFLRSLADAGARTSVVAPQAAAAAAAGAAGAAVLVTTGVVPAAVELPGRDGVSVVASVPGGAPQALQDVAVRSAVPGPTPAPQPTGPPDDVLPVVPAPAPSAADVVVAQVAVERQTTPVGTPTPTPTPSATASSTPTPSTTPRSTPGSTPAPTPTASRAPAPAPAPTFGVPARVRPTPSATTAPPAAPEDTGERAPVPVETTLAPAPAPAPVPPAPASPSQADPRPAPAPAPPAPVDPAPVDPAPADPPPGPAEPEPPAPQPQPQPEPEPTYPDPKPQPQPEPAPVEPPAPAEPPPAPPAPVDPPPTPVDSDPEPEPEPEPEDEDEGGPVVLAEHPADPSTGSTATFTFANAGGRELECHISRGGQVLLQDGGKATGWKSCPTGITYTDLETGSYAFMVRRDDDDDDVTTYTWRNVAPVDGLAGAVVQLLPSSCLPGGSVHEQLGGALRGLTEIAARQATPAGALVRLVRSWF